MPLRICPEDPLLSLLRRRFEGLHVLSSPTPSLRPMTVVALPRKGDPVELGLLEGLLLPQPGALPAPALTNEGLPDLAASATSRFGAQLRGTLLPSVLGAFGADARLGADLGADSSFTLRFSNVRASRVDRAALGQHLTGRALDPNHPATGFLLQRGMRFVVVDRVVLADGVEVAAWNTSQAQATAQAAAPELGGAAGGWKRGQDGALRVSTQAPTPVVLAWSGLSYGLDPTGRVQVVLAEVMQMGAGDAMGERIAAWGEDEAGEVRPFAARPAVAPATPSPMAAQGLLASIFGERAEPETQRTGSPGDQYGPTFDSGPIEIHQSAEKVGVVYTAPPSGGVVAEDMLVMRKSSGGTYPLLAPLTGSGTRAGVGVQTGTAAFTDREDFLDTAWDELDPPGGATVYHIRGAARRYTVDDPELLAEAMEEAQASEWVDKLVERDGSNNIVRQGWVYVEEISNSSPLVRIVHQFTPSAMALPPSTNTLTLEPAASKSLSELIAEDVPEGWKYAACRIEASVVTGSPLTASTPTAPAALGSGQGVTAS